MTDIELMELAARAADIEIYKWNSELNSFRADFCGHWNPLTNDAHAFLLAVQLGMNIMIDNIPDDETSCECTEISMWQSPETIIVGFDKTNNDPYAATRRAIVIAAAEIAKTKIKIEDAAA